MIATILLFLKGILDFLLKRPAIALAAVLLLMLALWRWDHKRLVKARDEAKAQIVLLQTRTQQCVAAVGVQNKGVDALKTAGEQAKDRVKLGADRAAAVQTRTVTKYLPLIGPVTESSCEATSRELIPIGNRLGAEFETGAKP